MALLRLSHGRVSSGSSGIGAILVLPTFVFRNLSIHCPNAFLSASRPRKHLSKLATVGDGDLGRGLTAGGTVPLDLLNDIQTLNDRAEDDVLAVQPTGLLSADEELGAVANELSAAVARVLEDTGD